MKMDADFPQILVQFSHQRHTQRPAILDGLDIFAYDLSVWWGQFLQPIANRLIARIASEKPDFKFRCVRNRMYQY